MSGWHLLQVVIRNAIFTEGGISWSFLHCDKILLIIAGVMADMSNGEISSNGGDGITSSTQVGR